MKNRLYLIYHLAAIGLRVHFRTPLTAMAIIVGFAAFAFIMTTIWTGYHAFGEVVREGPKDSLLVLSRHADTIASSKLQDHQVSLIASKAPRLGIRSGYAETMATVQLSTSRCTPAISAAIVARRDLFGGNPVFSGRRPAAERVEVGEALAAKCGIDADDEIDLAGRRFRVGRIIPARQSSDSMQIRVGEADMRSLFDSVRTPNTIVLAGGTEDMPQEKIIEALSSDDLKLVSMRDYHAQQAKQLLIPTIIVTMEVGGLMLVGAIVAVLLAMEIAIGSRTQEIGNLLVQGFTGSEISTALAIEGGVIALLGSLLGIGATFGVFSGDMVEMFAPSVNAQILISLVPDPLVAAIIAVVSFLAGLVLTFSLSGRFTRRLVGSLALVVKNASGAAHAA